MNSDEDALSDAVADFMVELAKELKCEQDAFAILEKVRELKKIDVEPEWARFAAMNENGMWYWYDTKPQLKGGFWMPTKGSLWEPLADRGCDYLKTSVQLWKHYLQERPKI